MIAPYARREAAAIVLLGGGLTVATGTLAGWWAVLPAALTVGLLAFYRDPPRRVPDEASLLVAPADGRVMFVRRNEAAPGGGPGTLRVGIFLSVLDVHVNRSPCAGRVLSVEYRPGRFHNALRAAATDQNECNTITLEPQPPLPGPVRVRQIAGLLARRIVCGVATGQRVRAGERVGMIKLGSQTELCVPDDERWVVLVRSGQHVRAGVSVLLRWRGDKP